MNLYNDIEIRVGRIGAHLQNSYSDVGNFVKIPEGTLQDKMKLMHS